jgi:hypothetical protein
MKDWRITLIESHPQLFRATAGKGTLSLTPNCGDGWRGLLECACKRIEAALAEGDTFVAREVGQRLGTLRFYWSGKLRASSQSLIADAVCRAEARSHCTCEECGESGRLYRSEGVLMTRCIVHSRGVLVPFAPGFENAHLARQVVDGQTKVIACRYDRESDTFVELRSASLNENGMSSWCFRDRMVASSEVDWLRCRSRPHPVRTCQRRNYNRASRYLHKGLVPPLREH